jgi:hypothetical protein
MSAKKGVFCLEGDWDESLTSRCSVEPQLRMLAEFGYRPPIHRDVATRAEFEHYLGRWLTKRYSDYVVGYLAFHGERRTIRLGRDGLTLEQLGDLVDGRAEDRIFYLGACQTLDVADEELIEFCKRSGARAVVGYTRAVEWLESAAFDFFLLPKLLDAVRMKPIFTSLQREHPHFVYGLGFRMATASWATERRPGTTAEPE